MLVLHCNGNRLHTSVSRCVCLAFRGVPKDSTLEASHLDGDGQNNRADNLIWETPSKNAWRKYSGYNRQQAFTPPEPDDGIAPF